MPVERAVTPRILSDARLVVGESPFWDAPSARLLCVDIIGRQLLRMDPQNEDLETWRFDDFPTAVCLSDKPDHAALTCAGGIVLFDLNSGQSMPFSAPEADVPGNRLNEAKADPGGRLWVGSMQTNLNPDGSMRDMNRSSGAVHRIGPDGKSEQLTDRSFGITNTMAWDMARSRFYVGDSLADIIYCYDYDDATGGIINKQVFCENAGPGVPDGSCLDADGFLWNCRYAGGCILRIAPDGAVDQIIHLPATNITDCTFGGSDLSTLFVTSATNGLTVASISENPYEGAVMAFEPGVRGRAENRVVIAQ